MRTLALAERELRTERPAFVMGIVNATPDSFWEHSRGGLDRALRLVDEGADMLDIGGESTRPGSRCVDETEELRRVVPLIAEIRRHSAIPISVDTRKAAVLRAALDEGADILNDVSALTDDDALAPLCAKRGIPVILMHGYGSHAAMPTNGRSAFAAVDAYLRRRVTFAENAGIARKKIILDPGIGFGKNDAANCTLIRRCGELCNGRYPVLMALSRKRVIGGLTGAAIEERLYGTLAADLLSVIAGASIIRVHDVKPAVDTLSVLAGIGIPRNPRRNGNKSVRETVTAPAKTAIMDAPAHFDAGGLEQNGECI